MSSSRVPEVCDLGVYRAYVCVVWVKHIDLAPLVAVAVAVPRVRVIGS